MPNFFKILPKIGLMYARFEGHNTVADSMDMFQEYLNHDDHAPGQKHFVDFSRVTSFEADYVKLLQFLATMHEKTPSTRTNTIFVYYAPTELTRSMARNAAHAFSGTEHIVVRVLDTEDAALSVLGLPYNSISDMLGNSAPADTPVS